MKKISKEYYDEKPASHHKVCVNMTTKPGRQSSKGKADTKRGEPYILEQRVLFSCPICPICPTKKMSNFL